MLAAAGVVVMTTGAAAPAMAKCLSPAEHKAIQTRVLQNDLMLMALACGERDRYNAFVTRFTSRLVAESDVVKAYFSRSYGGHGTTRMNSAITTFANDASTERLRVGDAVYCAQADQLYKAVLQLSGEGMVSYAAARPGLERHGFTMCSASTPPAKAAKHTTKQAAGKSTKHTRELAQNRSGKH